jgi:hypothetical protein
MLSMIKGPVLGWNACAQRLLGFLVSGMFPFKRAVFLELDAFRMLAFVLGDGIIPPIARRTFQRNNFSGHVYILAWLLVWQ